LLKSVIFDMDGVIVDSEPLHIRAERDTLEPYGVEITDDELQSYMGRTPKIVLENIIQKYQLSVSIEEIYPLHRKTLMNYYREEVISIPGALDLIYRLYGSDINLALASSSDIELIELVLDKFSLNSFFKVVVSGENVARAKPCPDIFLEVLKQLKCQAQECVVIEDSRAGVRAAKAAMIPCVGFRSPNSKNQDLQEAQLIVNDLHCIEIDHFKNLTK